jgi:hypothetical protein
LDEEQSLSPDIDPEVHKLLQQEPDTMLYSQVKREASLDGEESGDPQGSSPEGGEEEDADIDEDDDVAQRAMLLKQQSLQKNRKRVLAQTKT